MYVVLPTTPIATGKSSLAIKNTFPRRLMTLIALKTCARFYKHDGPCISISKSLIVKKGPFVHLTEAATMQFVAANTSIPVLAAHCSLVHKDRAYIVMQRIRGTSLAEAWKTLSAADLSNIFAQLRRMFQVLRALVPPDGVGVQSCLGDLDPDNHPDRVEDQVWKEIKEMVIKQDGLWPQPEFTHGDLNPFNILVRGDQVVGIIDWEFAGWHPCYWEYTSAWYGNRIRQD
ncbi:serine/threonine protein kinase [Fusarium oxysporum f. sp. albedinis]|nr:serine/threonine protein kinase [Fusarium oxysporum f. sp. albedinis]KAJ0143856.1 Uncharacterized protein HZ326_13321 [Fusarium oxysporum f. sp. albedinis]